MKQSGVVSIEFVAGFGLFWLVIVIWMELSFMSYVTALNDLALNQASHLAKKDSDNYMSVYKSVLEDEDSIWTQFVDPSKVIYSVRYAEQLGELQLQTDFCLPDTQTEEEAEEELINYKECDGPAENKSIATYYVSYEFKGLFTSLFEHTISPAREIIVVQEYERDKFVL
jgi:tight adherence protein E